LRSQARSARQQALRLCLVEAALQRLCQGIAAHQQQAAARQGLVNALARPLHVLARLVGNSRIFGRCRFPQQRQILVELVRSSVLAVDTQSLADWWSACNRVFSDARSVAGSWALPSSRSIRSICRKASAADAASSDAACARTGAASSAASQTKRQMDEGRTNHAGKEVDGEALWAPAALQGNAEQPQGVQVQGQVQDTAVEKGIGEDLQGWNREPPSAPAVSNRPIGQRASQSIRILPVTSSVRKARAQRIRIEKTTGVPFTCPLRVLNVSKGTAGEKGVRSDLALCHHAVRQVDDRQGAAGLGVDQPQLPEQVPGEAPRHR